MIEIAPGATRQVLAEAPELMLVAFRFEAGAEGALHAHPHAQATFVRAGRFAFEIGGERREVGPGNAFVIAPHVPHGCVCLEAGELIDSFAPRRDDFLEKE